MTTLIRTPRADRSRAASPALALTLRIARTRDRFPAALAGIAALFALCFAIDAQAQQVTNPGDIIVERTVTPRDAFVPVPRDQDPVAVRATTFPANSFNPAIAQLVGDTDLTNAHGSSGVADNGVLGGTGMQAVTQILSGRATGNNIALNSGSIGAPAAGIGGTITSSVTGALAPLSNVLSGTLGGLK
ncbi:hypothetical protein SAMN05443245_2608 [Paraburkholderia fungorum]|uniref:Uncharacterized protein n=1 Tax=Paraburkholderia fungorum TaxID=134537 RepID=A0A1H1DEA7_9BURK|nr:hypothetical protein [Paraburkholderia fungorum]SDQ74833.1 hypothetical protein SAMN05443245_2608 [Paraburkholderia fungorum]